MLTGTTATYELHVAGHLDDHWSAWLGDLAIRDLAVTLLSLRACDRDAGKAEQAGEDPIIGRP